MGKAKSLAQRFLSERAAAVLNRITLEPAGDLAVDPAVEAILKEQAGDSQSLRQKASLLSRDSMRSLLTEAIRARPGSAIHRFLLGKLALATGKGLDGRVFPEAWSTALWLASSAAPGLDQVWTAQAEAYLERWESLPQTLRDRSARVFAAAFQDPAFVSKSFVRAAAALGRQTAVGLLPERSDVVREAARSLGWQGDLQGAAFLFGRLEKVKRRERAESLRRIEERHRLGDAEGLRAACLDWSRQYPVAELDHPQGRSELARVLEIWPAFPHGSWRGDPRGGIVRFFLDARESAVSPAVVQRAIDSLTGVPLPVAARVRLLGGDPAGAERLHQASGGGELDWTNYLVARAQFELDHARPERARTLLNQVNWLRRDSCEVLLARRAAARALRDAGELEELARRLGRLRPSSSEPAWTSAGALSLCLDPEQTAGKSLRLEIAADAPALLTYGWDGGTLGLVFVTERRVIPLSLEGLSGERTLAIRPLTGNPRARFRVDFVSRRSKDLGRTT